MQMATCTSRFQSQLQTRMIFVCVLPPRPGCHIHPGRPSGKMVHVAISTATPDTYDGPCRDFNRNSRHVSWPMPRFQSRLQTRMMALPPPAATSSPPPAPAPFTALQPRPALDTMQGLHKGRKPRDELQTTTSIPFLALDPSDA